MKKEKDLFGVRVWEIDDNQIPKIIYTDDLKYSCLEDVIYHLDSDLDFDNKTYAIRIGKKGLK